jgi:hypothetical protein
VSEDKKSNDPEIPDRSNRVGSPDQKVLKRPAKPEDPKEDRYDSGVADGSMRYG